jgi:hypothetical protein
MAMAPPMAAEALRRPLPDLVGVLGWLASSVPPGAEVLLVETVGGVRSPLCAGADSLDLARALEPDLVVLVADAGLGVVNAVRLSSAALADLPHVVHLNRFDALDDLHARNRRFLAEDGGRAGGGRPAAGGGWRLMPGAAGRGPGYELTTSIDELAAAVRRRSGRASSARGPSGQGPSGQPLGVRPRQAGGAPQR